MQTDIKHYYLGNHTLPLMLLVVTNILGGLHVLPIFVQLLISSSTCVYLGCILSGRLSKAKDGQLCASVHDKDS